MISGHLMLLMHFALDTEAFSHPLLKSFMLSVSFHWCKTCHLDFLAPGGVTLKFATFDGAGNKIS